MLEPLAYYILQTVWCLILKGAALFWSTIKEDLSSLWLLLRRAEANLWQTFSNLMNCNFEIGMGKWLERNGWGSPWLSLLSKTPFESLWGNMSGRKKKQKENAVSFNCAKPAWKTSAWITATVCRMGILTVRHKFRHTNRNTCALCIWIPSQGREGGFQNLFICRFPRVGLMKNSKYMDNKRVCFFFFFYLQTNTMEVHESGLLLATTNAVFVGCSPNIRCIWFCGFSGSMCALKGSYLKSLIPAWLFCKEGHAGRKPHRFMWSNENNSALSCCVQSK